MKNYNDDLVRILSVSDEGNTFKKVENDDGAMYDNIRFYIVDRRKRMKRFFHGKRMLFLLVFIVAAAITSCGFVSGATSQVSSGSSSPGEPFSMRYPSSSKVGYAAEYLGTVARQHPETRDEGLPAYPVYGTVLYGSGEATDAEAKQALLNEDSFLRAGDATYDSMDQDGNLYLNGVSVGRKLYRHTASAGMYFGDVSDDEPALVKRIRIRSRASGDHITGLYAPAGEVVKLEMSEEDFRRTGGLVVYIGQVLANGQANNIWKAREFNRMPVIVNAMTMQAPIAYVGSYLGGPIYVKPVISGTTFSVTLSGGVAYPHFILGYTTEEEFARNRASSAPYFDLEVWDDGVRHSGPRSYADRFSYDDLYKAAVLWDKISTVSNRIPSGSKSEIGITFLYDPFVAAGAAVAFVGRNTVNCPPAWMAGSLDYDSFVTSGSWGNIHEYNHHYQRYGFAPGDEVTNNAVSLVSYSLFTKISSGRTLTGTLSGWNRFTVPSLSLQETIALSAKGTANAALDTYANLLHSFGQDAFVRAAQYGNGSGGTDLWFRSLCEATQYDMTYYFTELLHQTVSDSLLAEYGGRGYPMYVPVASVFQTGTAYRRGSQRVLCETVQPFEIDPETDFDLDFSQYIVLPEGFTYRIASVTAPQYGTLTKQKDMLYTYVPDPEHETSGRFSLTLQIARDDGAFEVEDVELILELKQKSDLLERSVYTYDAERMYSSVEEAFENHYAGYDTRSVGNNRNPVVNGRVVQDGNAEVWLPEPTQNAVIEVSGKVRIPEDGAYRFAIRGRTKVGLFTAIDSGSYSLAGTLENTAGDALFHTENPKTYSDYELKKGQTVFFRAVLLVTDSRSYIGVGWGKFSGSSVQINYMKEAYRLSAEYEEFTSGYFYPRAYGVAYDKSCGAVQTLVDTNYQPWDETYAIDVLFDGDPSNFIHSDRTPITEENPFEMTVDLGEEITANRMTILGEPTRKYQPKAFRLYVGNSLGDLHLLTEVKQAPVVGNDVLLDFDLQSFRYYRLIVTDTYAPNTKYIAFRSVDFSVSLSGGRLLSPDSEELIYRGEWSAESRWSTFGHICTGKENATLEFEFTGTQFGVFSYFAPEYGAFELYIDGVLTAVVSVNGTAEDICLAYLSARLSDGRHSVKIRGRGRFSIDSVFCL